jgi:hypothetical protein
MKQYLNKMNTIHMTIKSNAYKNKIEHENFLFQEERNYNNINTKKLVTTVCVFSVFY